MRNLHYRIYSESICFRADELPEYHFDLIDRLEEFTSFRPTCEGEYSNMFEALKVLADRRCTACLVPMCGGSVCLAEMTYIEEVEVLDRETDHCMMTGNRWFAEYVPVLGH